MLYAEFLRVSSNAKPKKGSKYNGRPNTLK